MTARLHYRLLAAAAALALAGCGPTGSPDFVARDAGSTTASKTTSMVEATGTKARVAKLRQQFRVPVVQPDPHLPVRVAPAATTTRPVIGPSIATGFRRINAEAMRPELPDGAKRAVLKSATVTLPTRADGTTRIEDDTSHVAVAFTLRGATSAAVTTAKGIAVYAQALPDADVVHRPSAEGTEDYVAFDRAPAREELVYDVDVTRVAGLRLVANTLEFVDATGAPRLRVAPPVVVDAEGKSRAATLSVDGCAFDTSPRAPWGRSVTVPGAASCSVRVTWSGASYPAIVDPSWVATGSMATARWGHTASVLLSGKVLVVGGESGSSYLYSAELYDAATATFAATGSMAMKREWHTASVLGSGKVLVAGGYGTSSLSESELYDPSTGTFAATGSMMTARYFATATGLASGSVLIAGGEGAAYLSSAELYDPTTGKFVATGSMTTPRVSFAASALQSGKVLVAGGYKSGGSFLSSADLYDPATGKFTATGSMTTARDVFTASLLVSGKVLIAGGWSGVDISSAELYDPTSGTFSATGPMAAARHKQTATVLNSGEVLVAGGQGGAGYLASAELYDPASGTFTATGPMEAARWYHTASLLPSGKVLVTGGQNVSGYLASAELYDIDGLGTACSTPDECGSGLCVDGYCCDTACDGQCEACDGPTPGTCSPVSGAPHGTRVACPESGVECGSSCNGTDRQQCTYAASGTACGSSTCSNDLAASFACDGKGTCGALVPVPCEPYSCDTTACKTNCVDSSDCATGYICASGACVLPAADAGTDSGAAGANTGGTGGTSDSGSAGSAPDAGVDADAAAGGGAGGTGGTDAASDVGGAEAGVDSGPAGSSAGGTTGDASAGTAGLGTDAALDAGAGAGATGTAGTGAHDGGTSGAGTGGNTSGTGGSSGSSGASGHPGSSASGAPGTTNSSANESGGCGCRTAPERGEPPWFALLSLTALVAARRRRTASNSKHRPA